MSEASASTATKAPWHFWAVGILGTLWNSIGAFSYYMTQTRNETYLKSVPPEQLEFYFSAPSWVVAAWAIGVWGGLLGCLLLLLRKGVAVPILLASMVGAALLLIRNYVLAEGLEVVGAGGAAFAGFIVVVAFGLWWYARRMKALGLLA
jgi:uncharacterized membrane protein